MDETVWGVVAATCFAFVAGGGVEFEEAGVGVDSRVHFQQALIDAAEFLRAEVFVVHGPADVAISDKSQGVNGFEEVTIGDEAIEQVGS